ncbi:nucleoside/nucleotide kinase family protein [Streptomyces gobiensis]|uniref:nucleoside/nucleotide kinase family protein n=1 Tax=Streptomyces gobiensis TaxID=2875706 RepID=UPI001E591D68|nr:nucleoside/nucleotide kinase family protein [Streptomyces gobiensis]UGY91585.1 nucleoside/nucleotide kinase family protein [Streptomyces gobiensis]
MRTEELMERAWRLAETHGRRPRAVLGLVGPPGSGKSALARALVSGLLERYGPTAAAYAPLDGFHLSNAQLSRLGLASRKGSPPTFDVAGYAALLSRIAAPGEHDIYCPDFDRTVDEPIAARHVVPPDTRLVITEGNYLACELPGWADARLHIDELWYVETPDDVREKRLLERQLAGGRGAAGAQEWVRTNDAPNGELVKASRSAPWINDIVHWSGPDGWSSAPLCIG